MCLYLDTLFDPEVASHGLPVLWAANIQKPLIDSSLHWCIKHLKIFCSNQWLGAAQPWQECWLQLGCYVTSWKVLIPEKKKKTNTEVLQTNAARLLLYLPYETAWNAAWQQTTWWVFSNPQLLKDCMCSSIDANTADDLGLWVLTRMNCSWRWRNALLPRVTVAPNAFCPSAAKHPQPQL